LRSGERPAASQSLLRSGGDAAVERYRQLGDERGHALFPGAEAPTEEATLLALHPGPRS
jgi:hypothetical protein